MVKYVIYMYRNTINNKIYIGQTCQDLDKRAGSNGIQYRHCPHFYAAIKKYGWKSFERSILFSDLSLEEANKLEIELIEKYKSYDADIGYNIQSGGDGFDTRYSKKLWENEEYRNNIIQKNKDLWLSEEYKKKQSATFKEVWKDPQRRKARSEKAKQRWANEEFHKKTQEAVLKTCAHPVRCIETGENFSSTKEACDKYNVSHGNLRRSIREGYRCGGYHWAEA